jgi:hypothetical protein
MGEDNKTDVNIEGMRGRLVYSGGWYRRAKEDI